MHRPSFCFIQTLLQGCVYTQIQYTGYQKQFAIMFNAKTQQVQRKAGTKHTVKFNTQKYFQKVSVGREMGE